MVHITTFMVAAAAVMMGVQSLDHSSAEAIGSQLVASEVLPSASVSEGMLVDDIYTLPLLLNMMVFKNSSC